MSTFIPLIAVVTGYGTFLAVLVIAARWVIRKYLQSILLAFIAGMIVATGVGFALSPGEGIERMVASAGLVLVTMSGAYITFHIINAGESSIRVRLIREIGSSGGLTEAGLMARYNDQVILDSRLDRLIEAGKVKRSGDHYHLVGTTFSAVSHVFTLTKRLLFCRDSEFGTERAP